MRPGERHVCAECSREATKEREIEGVIAHLCSEHAGEFDLDVDPAVDNDAKQN